MLDILKESSPRRDGFVVEKTLKQCISVSVKEKKLCCGVSQIHQSDKGKMIMPHLTVKDRSKKMRWILH